MTIFRAFNMAAVRHLGFLKVRNFNCGYGSENQYAYPCQIWCQSIQPLLRYGDFSIFQDRGRPPSWIYFARVWTTQEEYVVLITVQNLVRIGAVVFVICKFWYFVCVKLENAYSRPQFLGFDPLNGKQCPAEKRFTLACIRVVWAIKCANVSTRLTCIRVHKNGYK